MVTALVLCARAGLAVLLLAAGGAKLADLDGFAVAVAMFVPRRLRAVAGGQGVALAGAVAGIELAAGAISLCWPGLRWASLVVLALACGFSVVAAVGYIWHRDRPCRCFGALTRRGFGVRSLAQALLMTAVAVLATRPARLATVNLSAAAHLLLLVAAALLAFAAATAARALTAGASAAELAA
jgi:hypothetical protein